jgi:hypothetical protein
LNFELQYILTDGMCKCIYTQYLISIPIFIVSQTQFNARSNVNHNANRHASPNAKLNPNPMPIYDRLLIATYITPRTEKNEIFIELSFDGRAIQIPTQAAYPLAAVAELDLN